MTANGATKKMGWVPNLNLAAIPVKLVSDTCPLAPLGITAIVLLLITIPPGEVPPAGVLVPSAEGCSGVGGDHLIANGKDES